MYDIRTKEHSKINNIRFADPNDECTNCTMIFKGENNDGVIVAICDDEGDSALMIDTVDDAVNLMKSLEFAINEGWWE